MVVAALAARAALRPGDGPVRGSRRRSPARRADPVLVRAREPVPRRVQPAADPAARRLRADRAGPARVRGSRTGTGSARTGSSCCSSLVFSTRVISDLLAPFENHARRLRVRESRAMKAVHLTRAVLRRVAVRGRRAPTTSTWAASRVLAPDAFALWQRQPNHDRRHAIGVAAAGRARSSPARRTPATRVWIAAALLHDIGKLDARSACTGGSVATVAGAAGGPRHGRRVVGDAAASRAGSGSTCATPSSAPTASASPGGPEEAGALGARAPSARDPSPARPSRDLARPRRCVGWRSTPRDDD